MQGEKLLQHGSRIPEYADAAVPVAGPCNREFENPQSLPLRAQDDFDVEHEPVGTTLNVEHARAVAAVDLETALRVRKMGRDVHPRQDVSVEDS